MGRIEGSAGGMKGRIGGSNTKRKLRRQNQESNSMKVGGDERAAVRQPREISKFSTENLLSPGNCSARQHNMKNRFSDEKALIRRQLSECKTIV